MILVNILWPTFALVLLIFLVWTTMAVKRIAHTRRVPPTRETFTSREAAAAYFAPVDLPANNLANLFEMPVLFFALVPLLIFVVWMSAAVSRLRYTRRVPPARDTFASRESAAAYFAPVDLPANNMANLFEMPVLFFALVPLLLITRSADYIEVALAWLFVLARVAHSYWHVVVRNVRQRFLLHVTANAILSAMWIGFLVDMVAAALAYHRALGAMGGVQP